MNTRQTGIRAALLAASAVWATGISAGPTHAGAPAARRAAGPAAWPRLGQAEARAVRDALSGPALQAALTAADAQNGDEFGITTAISGAMILVGAAGWNDAHGAVDVFTWAGGHWRQRVMLAATGGRSQDYFGAALAIGGATAVAGAYARYSGTGAAYPFAWDGTSWRHGAMLTAAGGGRHDEFGAALALDARTALIGAPGKNADAGAVYVFVRHGPGWQQQGTLIPSGGAPHDYFGSTIAMSGDTALVGAPGTNEGAGAVYVFARQGTAWRQQARFADPAGQGADSFGGAIAFDGETALVGASGTNEGAGAVYVFARQGTTWRRQAMLVAADAAANDLFGSTVALSGTLALIGAPGKSDGLTDKVGAAYLFARGGTGWRQRAALADPNDTRGDLFGSSVALGADTAVIGAEGDPSSPGMAYVYRRL